MVEKVVERGREPEPEELFYDLTYKWRAEWRRQREVGKVVIKGNDMPWEQNRQGLIKHYMHPKNWDELGVPSWLVFIHEIRKNSGRHRHQGGLGIFVLEGRGYTVVDGVRYDWEAGDLIILPMKPNGCE
ncbi:MAG: cupin domain-containing protein, partial [Dehalococcoidia bacterium]